MLSVIIVTYNGMQWLERCLASVPTSYELVIVDNHSTDGTVAFIEENYPKAKLFKEKQNLGFGQANNKGIRYALKQGADYVYLLNQDAYLEANTIEELIKIHSEFPEFAVLSPVHTNKKKTRLDAGFSNYVKYKKNKNFYSDFVLNLEKKKVYDIPFINAAGWLLPKKTLEIIGGFDPIFFHYGEDDNYCQRVKYHGFKVGVVPHVYMVHDREEREGNEITIGSHAYFSRFERDLKIRCANILVCENETLLTDEISLLKKLYRKQLILFKFSKAKLTKQKLILCKKIQEEVKISISINRSVGKHYLQ